MFGALSCMFMLYRKCLCDNGYSGYHLGRMLNIEYGQDGGEYIYLHIVIFAEYCGKYFPVI